MRNDDKYINQILNFILLWCLNALVMCDVVNGYLTMGSTVERGAIYLHVHHEQQTPSQLHGSSKIR